MRVSHETIYRSLLILARGVLKKEPMGHLRSQRRIRHSQQSRVGGQSRGQIVDAISIRERPAEIEDRAIAGHWEGDLLGGTKNSHIASSACFATNQHPLPMPRMPAVQDFSKSGFMGVSYVGCTITTGPTAEFKIAPRTRPCWPCGFTQPRAPSP
jgi:hypothetical protein